MKSVIAHVPPEVLAWRKQTGADRYDEMWAGVLHMAPSPNRDHQKLEFGLERALEELWSSHCRGLVCHQLNVARPGRWPSDYRIPDLLLLADARRDRDRNEYVDGGPNVVIEIESPGDETRAKLAFYAELDVREVWIVGRDTRRVELLRREGAGFAALTPDAEGWLASNETGLELRCREELLELRRTGEPDSAVRLGPRGRA
jgi:Uma2 family endonuclease